MRKGLVVIVMLCLLVFMPVLALAWTVLEKPTLPADYMSWPQSYRSVCYTRDDGAQFSVEIFGRNLDNKMVEAVSTLLKNNAPVIYLHDTQPHDRLALYTGFTNPHGAVEWKGYDSTIADDKLTIALMIDAINEMLRERCPAVDRETDEFFKKLYPRE